MILRPTAAVMALAVLAGCVSTPPPRQVGLGGECYSTLSQLPTAKLGYRSPAEEKKLRATDFADVARCLRIGKSEAMAAALFELDQVAPPSVIRTQLTASSHGVLAASVALLDSEYRELTRIGFDAFSNRGNVYSADLFVNDVNARYVLISPDRSAVGNSEMYFSSVSNTTTIPVGAGFASFTTGSQLVQQRSFADAGTLLVTIKAAHDSPIKPRK